MPTVPRDLPNTDRPPNRPLAQPGVETSQPGHSAGPAALPLLGVSLIRQLRAGISLEPEPAGLQGAVTVETGHGGAICLTDPPPVSL